MILLYRYFMTTWAGFFALTVAPHQDIRNELRRPNHELEVNMAKLAVFVNEFLQHVHSSNQVELTDYERYLHSLEEWSASLPRSLQYFLNSSNATEQSDLSSEDEFASVSNQM